MFTFDKQTDGYVVWCGEEIVARVVSVANGGKAAPRERWVFHFTAFVLTATGLTNLLDEFANLK